MLINNYWDSVGFIFIIDFQNSISLWSKRPINCTQCNTSKGYTIDKVIIFLWSVMNIESLRKCRKEFTTFGKLP